MSLLGKMTRNIVVLLWLLKYGDGICAGYHESRAHAIAAQGPTKGLPAIHPAELSGGKAGGLACTHSGLCSCGIPVKSLVYPEHMCRIVILVHGMCLFILI